VPAWQGLQLAVPVADWNLPALQFEHVVWFELLWYVPVGHFVHKPDMASEYVPTAQLEHEPRPASALNIPALQLKQVDEPCAVWYVPALQSVHLVAPAADMVPAIHALHFPLSM